MALVVPPPSNRSRANSTCVRPALSINTLGRRRSSSLVLPVQQPDTDVPTVGPSPPLAISQPSMLSVIAAKCLELLHLAKLHPFVSSSPSSPHSSDVDLVLPLSASSQSTFGDVLSEKDGGSYRWRPFHPSVSHALALSRPPYSSFSQAHAPILLVMLLFPLSTSFVFLSLYSLPISVTWPRTLAELAELGRELQKYSQLGPGPFAHVIGVLSITAAWKHAWSIPGSVIWVSF